ncbi:MAG TPA: serine/threonine-protein kinase [Kofleriaceae bacterium]|jgi:serine/threonine-protein kinase
MVGPERYILEECIGSGAFGAVYRARQLGTQRPVALKILHEQLAGDPALVERFRREAAITCSLRSPHTITVYEVDTTPDGRPYFAMELLAGKSLEETRRDGPMPWQRAFEILVGVCRSLEEAHALGIVHRDLKPEHIFLESRHGNPDFVKVLDFGIAKRLTAESWDERTAAGQLVGTPEYMSPEQVLGRPIDGRSDLYTLGVLAFTLIAGQTPFADVVGLAGLAMAHLDRVPVPLGSLVDVPASVDRIVARCLAKDPDRRYADARALCASLERALAGGAETPRCFGFPEPHRLPHVSFGDDTLVDAVPLMTFG